MVKELIFQYTKEEYIEARRQYLLMSKIITKTGIVIMPLLLVMEGVWLYLDGISALTVTCGLVFIMYLAFLFILYVYQPARFYDKSEALKTEHRFIVSPSGIEGNGETASWTSFGQLWENKKFFYLVQNRNTWLLFPKRIFSTDSELEEFKAAYREYNPKGIYKLFP